MKKVGWCRFSCAQKIVIIFLSALLLMILSYGFYKVVERAVNDELQASRAMFFDKSNN